MCTGRRRIIPEYPWRPPDVSDDEVEVPIAVDIAKSQSTTNLNLRSEVTAACAYLAELPMSIILK